jgi:hypothetical protein
VTRYDHRTDFIGEQILLVWPMCFAKQVEEVAGIAIVLCLAPHGDNGTDQLFPTTPEQRATGAHRSRNTIRQKEIGWACAPHADGVFRDHRTKLGTERCGFDGKHRAGRDLQA